MISSPALALLPAFGTAPNAHPLSPRRPQRRQQLKEERAAERFASTLASIQDGLDRADGVNAVVDRIVRSAQDSRDRRKHDTHAEWQAEVFDKIQAQVEAHVDSISVPDLERSLLARSRAYCRTADSRGVFREVIDRETYDPFAYSKGACRVATAGLRDPLDRDLRKDAFERSLLRSAGCSYPVRSGCTCKSCGAGGRCFARGVVSVCCPLLRSSDRQTAPPRPASQLELPPVLSGMRRLAPPSWGPAAFSDSLHGRNYNTHGEVEVPKPHLTQSARLAALAGKIVIDHYSFPRDSGATATDFPAGGKAPVANSKVRADAVGRILTQGESGAEKVAFVPPRPRAAGWPAPPLLAAKRADAKDVSLWREEFAGRSICPALRSAGVGKGQGRRRPVARLPREGQRGHETGLAAPKEHVRGCRDARRPGSSDRRAREQRRHVAGGPGKADDRCAARRGPEGAVRGAGEPQLAEHQGPRRLAHEPGAPPGGAANDGWAAVPGEADASAEGADNSGACSRDGVIDRARLMSPRGLSAGDRCMQLLAEQVLSAENIAARMLLLFLCRSAAIEPHLMASEIYIGLRSYIARSGVLLGRQGGPISPALSLQLGSKAPQRAGERRRSTADRQPTGIHPTRRQDVGGGAEGSEAGTAGGVCSLCH